MKPLEPLTFPQISSLSEIEARGYLEAIVWGNVPICPHCKNKGGYKLIPKINSKSPVRHGVYACKACRKQFTVTVGTVFEKSHIPIKKWLLAIALLCASKKGISSHQIHRLLGVTYKTAWFMMHRLRHAFSKESLENKLSGIIEIDDGYIGGKTPRARGGKKNKARVVVLVERDGRVLSRVVPKVTAQNVRDILNDYVNKDATIYTDGFYSYRGLNYIYGKHITLIGTKEGCGQDGSIHVNHAENFIGLFKRGLRGIYQHVSKKHLQKYLDEFDFRYSLRQITDNDRLVYAIEGIVGKRLCYRENVA